MEGIASKKKESLLDSAPGSASNTEKNFKAPDKVDTGTLEQGLSRDVLRKAYSQSGGDENKYQQILNDYRKQAGL
jgi:hypothetical protein